MGDESLGAMAAHMAYHTHCNCFSSPQRLKCWRSGKVRGYHKSAKIILGSVTAVIVHMSKFDLRMFLVYKCSCLIVG